MSVAICTMGKFIPAVGGTVIERIVEVGGGGSYGLEKSKPHIIVRGVYGEEDDINIKVIKVTEWS